MIDGHFGNRKDQTLRIFIAVLLTAVAIANSGCASRGSATKGKNVDPFEPVNRGIYRFNDATDRFILRPAAKGYQWITPDPVQVSISNAFDNWTYPVTIVNGFLQAKFKQGFSDTGRFLVNTTIGILGLFDPATPLGLVEHREDFGQTFAKWGAPPGPFIMVPLFGPRTILSGIGTLADVQVNPLVQWRNTSMRDKALILWAIETRASLIGPDKIIEDAFDPYLFVRDAYLQNREFLISDGKTLDGDADFDADFDDGLDEDF
jgi:phospholipid-binding lipoprotein MlaA